MGIVRKLEENQVLVPIGHRVQRTEKGGFGESEVIYVIREEDADHQIEMGFPKAQARKLRESFEKYLMQQMAEERKKNGAGN